MKKLAALFLILVMLVSAASLAEDRDPIIGAWYVFYDMDVTPEMKANFPGNNKIFSIYDFTEDGTIMLLELDEQNGTGTPTFAATGKWSKEGNKYNYSIIGMGESDMYIKNNCLYLNYHNMNVSLA